MCTVNAAYSSWHNGSQACPLSYHMPMSYTSLLHHHYLQVFPMFAE